MATMRCLFYVAILAATTSGAAAEEIARVDDDRIEWLRRIDEARERYETFASRVVADLSRETETREIEARAGREDSGLADPTLRRGDIVVTATGLLMFKGSSKLVYDLADFEPVGESCARRSRHRAALLDILRDRARAGR
jgi:hypothetical protein